MSLSNTTSSENVGVGAYALATNTTGSQNTACGPYALQSNTTGNQNTAVGPFAMRSNTTGSVGTAIGISALQDNTIGINNVACGAGALQLNISGSSNTAVGHTALVYNTTGGQNSACGQFALSFTQAGGANQTFSNCTGLGNDARVSASNQVQLGNAATTTYIYGAINNRSDMRDKADIRDTVLGLDFVQKLRPVDYRWDLRDDYLEKVIRIERIEVETSESTRPGIVTELDAAADPAPADLAADPAAGPEADTANPEPVVEPEPGVYDILVGDDIVAHITYPSAIIELVDSTKEYESNTLDATCPALPDLKLRVKTRVELKTLPKNGSKKRNRYHHGLIAQEVESVLQESGIDFGGFQHHSVGGGEDIYTIGYSELFGPLIKAVQELAAENAMLKSDIAAIKAHVGLA